MPRGRAATRSPGSVVRPRLDLSPHPAPMIVEAGLTCGGAGVLGDEKRAEAVTTGQAVRIGHDVASENPLEKAAKHGRSPLSRVGRAIAPRPAPDSYAVSCVKVARRIVTYCRLSTPRRIALPFEASIGAFDGSMVAPAVLRSALSRTRDEGRSGLLTTLPAATSRSCTRQPGSFHTVARCRAPAFRTSPRGSKRPGRSRSHATW